MHLTIKDSINCLDDWYQRYPPLEKIHWKEKRSAMELARLFVESLPKVPIQVSDAIKDLAVSKKFSGEGEFATKLLGKGGARKHDFIMASDDLLVAIEAKADEAFDDLISKKLKFKDNTKESQRMNRNVRYNGLMQLLFGQDVNEANDVRYQLVSATTATLIEAKRRGLLKAVLLIIVFESDQSKKSFIERNDKDLSKFMKQMQANELGLVKVFDERFKDISLYIRKITINQNR